VNTVLVYHTGKTVVTQAHINQNLDNKVDPNVLDSFRRSSLTVGQKWETEEGFREAMKLAEPAMKIEDK